MFRHWPGSADRNSANISTMTSGQPWPISDKVPPNSRGTWLMPGPGAKWPLWAVEAEVDFLVRQGCLVSVAVPLGNAAQRIRVTYTGGYVMPGTTPGEGETALPSMLTGACVEQTAFWFQQGEQVGRRTSGASGVSYQTLQDVDLLPGVRAGLRK